MTTLHPKVTTVLVLCLVCCATLAACSTSGRAPVVPTPAVETRVPAPAMATATTAAPAPIVPVAPPPQATAEPPSPTPAPAEPFIYRVQAGDTLFALAIRYGVTVEELMAANRLTDADTLALDQELTIPIGGLPEQALPSVPTFPPMPDGPFATYAVQAGDTLSGIALRYGVSTNDLIAANRLTDPDALRPGQELLVPAGAVPADTPAPPAPTAPPSATPIPPVPGSTHEQYRAWMEEAHAVHPYAEPVDWMWSVMMCESRGYHDLVGSGKYYGLFQYLQGTWNGEWNPYRDNSIFDPRAQIFATAKAWQDGHQSWWRGCWPG